MMIFLNPLDALIPKIPFAFFADFWVWVTPEARGSVSLGFWGSRQLSPFWEGGSSQGALSTPPPPSLESPVAQGMSFFFPGYWGPPAIAELFWAS